MLVVMINSILQPCQFLEQHGRSQHSECGNLTCLGGVAAAPLGSAWTAVAAPAAVPAAAPAAEEEVSEGWAAAVSLALLSALVLAGA